MNLYIWPNGEWIYEWETSGFTLEHSTVPLGGRWVDADSYPGIPLTPLEEGAIREALGE